jgi:hypothetical protein
MSSAKLALGSKFLRLFIAWAIGGGIYFIYAIATVYDGFPSLVCQPFMAMGISAVFTFIALIIGLPLMLLTPYRSQSLAIIVACIGLLIGFSLLFIPKTFTFMFQNIFPAIQNEDISAIFMPVFLGYFIVIFTIVNWPRIRFIKP